MESLSPSEYSKRKLLLAAIKLFSEQGIEGVSLRMINREAGNKNNSALHYHFGSKGGLVEEVVQFIQKWFEYHREAPLSKLENIEEGPSVKEIVEAFISPYLTLIDSETWGFHAVRLLSKMEQEAEPEIHRLLNKSGKKSVTRFKRLLFRALPDLPEKELTQRFNYCITSIIHGLADHENLKYSYMGNIKISLKSLGKMYVRYNSYGLSAPKE